MLSQEGWSTPALWPTPLQAAIGPAQSLPIILNERSFSKFCALRFWRNINEGWCRQWAGARSRKGWFIQVQTQLLAELLNKPTAFPWGDLTGYNPNVWRWRSDCRSPKVC